MKRLLADTNIYGELILDADYSRLKEAIAQKSEDNKSMLSELALKSYALVHALKKRRTPTFIGYLEFKRWLRE